MGLIYDCPGGSLLKHFHILYSPGLYINFIYIYFPQSLEYGGVSGSEVSAPASQAIDPGSNPVSAACLLCSFSTDRPWCQYNGLGVKVRKGTSLVHCVAAHKIV